MNGVSLVAVQAVLSSPGAGKLSSRLAGVGQEIRNSAVARKLMATPSSDLGAFLRLVRDAAAGVDTTGSKKTPAVELRKELESLDEASLEDLVAILVSIQDALGDTTSPKTPTPGYRNGALGLGSDRVTGTVQSAVAEVATRGKGAETADAGTLDIATESASESSGPASGARSEVSPVSYPALKSGAGAAELLTMVRRLQGMATNNATAAAVASLNAESLSNAATQGDTLPFPGFTTDSADQRAVAQTDPVLKAMASAMGTKAANASTAQTRSTQSATPDLIYIPVVAGSSEVGSTRGGSVERIELVSLGSISDSDPVQVLQDVVRRVEQAVLERQQDGADPEHVLDPEMETFVSGRLSSSPRSSAGITFTQAAAGQHSEVVADAVRQTQAAVADMAERQMNGDVRVDSDRMRAVMHLEPPVLGRVHIQLQVENGTRVQVTVGADQQGTQDFLKDHQEDLKQGLADQGFQREDIDIRFDEDQAESFQGWLGTARV